MMLDAVILSDLHLGSSNCEAKRLCRLLDDIAVGRIVTNTLILNGDVFDSIDFRRLTKHHWKVLSFVRKLSDQIDIIWIAGNHDGSAEVVSHLLGVTVKEEHILTSGGRRVLVLHGHRFDDFIDAHPILTAIGDCIYFFLQWVDRSHYFAKLAKKGSKTFLRCIRKIQDGAIDYARRKKCDAVCCGHTHHATELHEGDVTYFNSGCWTELPCSYLTIAEGRVELQRVEAEEPVEDVEATVLAEPAGATVIEGPGSC